MNPLVLSRLLLRSGPIFPGAAVVRMPPMFPVEVVRMPPMFPVDVVRMPPIFPVEVVRIPPMLPARADEQRVMVNIEEHTISLKRFMIFLSYLTFH